MNFAADYGPPRCVLADLLPELGLPPGLAAIAVNGASLDSRAVVPGNLFFGLPGGQVDGRRFVADALGRGAVAVLQEGPGHLGTAASGQPVISIARLSEQVSQLAGRIYGDPSAQVPVIGVTGTNGKSTVVALLAQLSEVACGAIGTLGAFLGAHALTEPGLTTPDAVRCQALLQRMTALGAGRVAMEVSSHGLSQGRVAGIAFNTAIFTNLTHDHLDYHGDLAHYAAAKQRLFEFESLAAGVINLDDPAGAAMLAALPGSARGITYGLWDTRADVSATELQFTDGGTTFKLLSPWGEAWLDSPLLGEFNVYNLLAALAALLLAGVPLSVLVARVPNLRPVAGRMQRVTGPGGVQAVVDYAHTPDALVQAIRAARVHTRGRLWVVFGCGGDRDRAKRAVMGAMAEKLADRVIVTSDNPRSESPAAIAAEIVAGMSVAPEIELDRAAAINRALTAAAPDDVVLIAGKGHENYQEMAGVRSPFDDVAEARRVLAKRAGEDRHAAE